MNANERILTNPNSFQIEFKACLLIREFGSQITGLTCLTQLLNIYVGTKLYSAKLPSRVTYGHVSTVITIAMLYKHCLVYNKVGIDGEKEREYVLRRLSTFGSANFQRCSCLKSPFVSPTNYLLHLILYINLDM